MVVTMMTMDGHRLHHRQGSYELKLTTHNADYSSPQMKERGGFKKALGTEWMLSTDATYMYLK